MNNTITQRSLANVCLFCNEVLQQPTLCRFCGFKFCGDHISTDDHQCIKTRYTEYIKRGDTAPNITTGKFKVVCGMCGYVSKKATPIEYAGEELTQHTQIVGCTQKIFLEESTAEENAKQVPIIKEPPKEQTPTPLPGEKKSDFSSEASIVEQILKLSSFKEKGMISEDEFKFIKSELIKKLKS